MNIRACGCVMTPLLQVYNTNTTVQADLCRLITLALPDGPFSFSSLSSVSPRRLRSSALTLRSRWDTCQKATLPHKANNWARHTQFTVGVKHRGARVTSQHPLNHACVWGEDAPGRTLFTFLLGFLRLFLNRSGVLVGFAAFCDLIEQETGAALEQSRAQLVGRFGQKIDETDRLFHEALPVRVFHHYTWTHTHTRARQHGQLNQPAKAWSNHSRPTSARTFGNSLCEAGEELVVLGQSKRSALWLLVEKYN